MAKWVVFIGRAHCTCITIYFNSHEKLTKSLIVSSWSQFEHIWSLFAPIHMKGSPKSKLGQVGVGSNIAQNHSSSPYEVISGH